MAIGIDSNHVYLPKPDQSKVTGACQVAPVGTECPETAREELGDTWTPFVGYVSEDGLTVSGLVAAGDAIRDWSKSKVRTTDGDAEPTIKLTAIQVDAAMLKLIVGEGNVTVKDATATAGQQTKVAFDGGVGPMNALCFSMKDGKRRVRVFVPNSQVTDLDDVSFVPGDAHAYAMTFSLNADGDGKYVYFIYDDGVVKAA